MLDKDSNRALQQLLSVSNTCSGQVLDFSNTSSHQLRFYLKRSAMSDEELARLEALGVRWPRANPRVAVCFR